MLNIVKEINDSYKKSSISDVRSGDTVKVHQRIKEGNKERIQVFQGLVIKTSKQGSHLARINVRRIASGVGVEKSFLLHNPMIVKVEVIRRSKVRRNYLSYMRQRTGKSARLSSVTFDKEKVNADESNVVEKESKSAKEEVDGQKSDSKTKVEEKRDQKKEEQENTKSLEDKNE